MAVIGGLPGAGKTTLAIALVAEQRLIERAAAGADTSDADADVASRMAQAFDDWPGAMVVDTGADG